MVVHPFVRRVDTNFAIRFVHPDYHSMLLWYYIAFNGAFRGIFAMTWTISKKTNYLFTGNNNNSVDILYDIQTDNSFYFVLQEIFSNPDSVWIMNPLGRIW